MTNARFSILQSRAVSDKRITNSQFRTLAALGIHGDKDGWCYPKLKTLGDMLGKSKQAVSRDIQALREMGYLEVRPQFREDGSQGVNLYRLLFDTRQPVVDPHKQGVDVPSTPDVDPPSTPEVDALTPHINAPYSMEEGENSGTIFQAYESNIGVITPMISEELQELEKEHPAEWIIAAMRIASVNGKRSLGYFKAILKRWKVDGYGTELKPAQKRGNGKDPLAGIKQFLEEIGDGEPN